MNNGATARASRSAVLWLLIALLAVTPVLAGPRTVHAQENPEIVIRAEAGFGGDARNGHWAPVIVDLENQGATDLEGELWVQDFVTSTAPGADYRYVQEVVLPAGGQKRFTTFLPLQSATREIDVQVVAKGRRIASAKPRVTLIGDDDVFVGVIGERTGAYNLLSTLDLPGERRSVVVVAVPAETLPSRPELLNAFDAIVVPEQPGTPLPEGSLEALKAWVAVGGTLVTPATQANGDMSWLPRELLPAIPGNGQQLEGAPSFDEVGGEPLAAGVPVTVAATSDITGQVIVEQDGLPLAVRGRYGAGRVLYLAFDPSAQPFLSWGGMANTWEALLLPSLSPSALAPSTVVGMPSRQFANQNTGMQWLHNAIVNLPSLDPPSTGLMIGLLLAYIALVGPVNYYVLRRMRRATLAWATVPALVAVFSLGTYFMAVGAKGNDVQANIVNVVQWMPDSDWARVRHMVGVFVPSAGDHTVEVPGDGLLSTVRQDYNYRYGSAPGGGVAFSIRHTETGGRADLHDMDQWTMQALQTESIERVQGQFISDLYIEGSSLKGTVTNGTNVAVENLWVGTGSGAVDLGALAPGASATVDIPLVSTVASVAESLVQQIESSRLPQQWSGDPSIESRRWEQQAQALRGAVFTAFEDGGQDTQVLLVGWTGNERMGVTVNGRAPSGNELTIFMQPVSPRPRGAVSLPGGMIAARLADVEIDRSAGGRHQIQFESYGSTVATSFSTGDVTYEFDLPWQDVRLERLAVQLPFNGPALTEGLQVQAYRWAEGVWDDIGLKSVSVQSAPPGYAQGAPYSSYYPGSGPNAVVVRPAPYPAATATPEPVQGVATGGPVSVLVSRSTGYGPVFNRALEGELSEHGPVAYVSSGGAVRVRLRLAEDSGSSYPTTLGMPTLAIEAVTHGS